MENNDNKRRKRVISGTASLNRRDDKPVDTNGPVGRKDGYQGRKTQFGAQKPSGSTEQQGGSLLSSLLGGSQQGQNTQSQNTGSANQNTQYTQNTTEQNTFGSPGSQSSGTSGRGLFGGKFGKILLFILAAILIFMLIRCVLGGCSTTDITGDASSGLTSNDSSFYTQNDSSTYTQSDSSDYTQDIGGSDAIPDSSVQQSYLSDTLAQLFQSNEDPFDVTDSSAPAAVTASTSSTEASYTVSNKARDRYTKIKGSGKDTVTLMVYLCGSDLESEHSMATADLNEMLHANLNDNKVNIIVETGGAKKWNNSVISNKTNQRYRVTSKGLQILDKNVGKKSMVDPNTLIDFIQFCAKNYPANRYMLIMWDHGGGAISGYGYDQTASGTMTLDKLNSALKKGGVKFDFIGFDACLMGTLETAVVMEQYADYLIASEESEPGTGWYYTNWLSALSKNTSIGTVELSKTLIDDFTDVSKKNYPGCNTTLSIVDLAEFAGTVPEAFEAFSGEIGKMLDDKEYQQVADARADAREFGVSAKVNHIDVIDFANRIGSSKSNALAKVLKSCVKYNRTSVSMKNSNGLSIYFPYSSFKSMNSAVALYNNIGISGEYSRCIKSFASLAAGGQIATGGTTSSPFGSLFGGYESTPSSSSGDILSTLLGGYLGGSGSDDSLSSLFGGSESLYGGSSSSGGAMDFLGSILGGDSSGWFDSGRALANKDYYDQNTLTVADMTLTEKDDEFVLELSKEKWDLVKSIRINVFAKEGDHYVDLGMDNADILDANGEGMRNSDGDLRIKFDNTWMTVNKQPVAYYFMQAVEDGNNWAEVGYVPILLNGERYYMFIVFDNEIAGHEDGYVAGVQPVYDESETPTLSKGFIQLKAGDKIDFIFDCYSEDGTYDHTYIYGKQITVKNALTVGYMDLGGLECDVTYCLTDIYGNEFWTEAITFE